MARSAAKKELEPPIIAAETLSALKTHGIDQNKPDDVLSLLAIRFIAGDSPSGTIELTFSANAAIRLSVECIEAQMTDLGSAWETTSLPRHDVV